MRVESLHRFSQAIGGNGHPDMMKERPLGPMEGGRCLCSRTQSARAGGWVDSETRTHGQCATHLCSWGVAAASWLRRSWAAGVPARDHGKAAGKGFLCHAFYLSTVVRSRRRRGLFRTAQHTIDPRCCCHRVRTLAHAFGTLQALWPAGKER